MFKKSFPVNETQESTFPVGLISNSPWEFCSFEPITYIYFNIAFVIIAYPLYRIVAGWFQWELDYKTPAKHFSDMIALVRYGFIVFVLGGYARTFGWIMILSFYIAMFGYGLLAELPFAKTSLPRWRNWSIRMWKLFIMAVFIILAMAGFHIYFAIGIMEENKFREKDDLFINWYLGCLVIPLILMMIAQIFKQEQNTRILTKFYLNIINIFIKYFNYQSKFENVENIKPYHKISSIHLHHWQIFYTLAFFTRFNNPISQVAGGITLAIYTQGIGAYGPDDLLLEKLRID